MQLPGKPQPVVTPERLEAFARGMAAVKVECLAKGFKAGRGGHGSMPCPMHGCKGRVSFIVYTNTGLTMAACNQPRCLNKLE